MSQRRFRFHIAMILIALVIGGLSLWHSGLWLIEENRVPNFTAIAMVFIVLSQWVTLREGLKKGKD
ncbi:MAG: hypothetical protein HLUCCX10_06610 [Algoriphagus marincola HL-49]|uniref:Uncharacterized protein n=1 Tax=Algoriphagus marincola HL-49 TaxID=1305737 RepID=A0A0P7XL01_9BACT|nr:MAG: hypothetical protein HLUCCX10_06610 [Algoriphagus marincola HL-49]